MRSHWTNPTIIRRPTIAALSAAALLVACDQPAGPSRRGGGIVADAQAGTISAKGNAQVAEALDCATGFPLCIAGGQGADVSVDFTAPSPTLFDQDVPANGTFSVKYRDGLGDQVDYLSGLATIDADLHELKVSGTCVVTTVAGSLRFGTCSLFAQDNAQPNGGDIIEFQFNAATQGRAGSAGGQVISGGIRID